MAEIEQKTRQVPVKATIRYDTELYFVTTDGREFGVAKKARAHQDELDAIAKEKALWASIQRLVLDVPLIGEFTWYYAESVDQLELIKKNLGWHEKYAYHHCHGDISVGSWITCDYEDGGDYRSNYEWYSMDYVINELSVLLDRMVNKK